MGQTLNLLLHLLPPLDTNPSHPLPPLLLSRTNPALQSLLSKLNPSLPPPNVLQHPLNPAPSQAKAEEHIGTPEMAVGWKRV